MLQCATQRYVFSTTPSGYLDFTRGGTQQEDTTTEEYAEGQHVSGFRVYEEYVKPWLNQEPFQKVLDAGCGIGKGVSALAEEGRESYGVDLPNLSGFWSAAGNDPNRFFCADASGFLPFKDNYFDAIYSLGVIEHIGTATGHSMLSPDYKESRRRYASELVRVLRPGGRILLSCPHKHFPFDIQHGPLDPASPKSPIREYIWRKAHVTIHKTWGHYYLPSYSEVEGYFSQAGARSMEPLPLKGYFGFASFEHKSLKPFLKAANLYVEHLPKPLRRTPLNPYMLAQITK